MENAYEEGIDFRGLTNPIRFLADSRGWVAAMECVEMELGELDNRGRRKPVPKKGSNFLLETDTVIIALGTTPNPLVPATTAGLKTTQEGTVVVDASGKTTKPGVWAGGDVATGAATVISAMGAGRNAAASMHEYLQSLPLKG
jgi:glutamate synthase (NADPH/NADH) small chain